MRKTSTDEVYITTIVVKGTGDPVQQHELVTQAVLAAMATGTGLQRPERLLRPPGLRPRSRPALPRGVYLALSLLFLAGALISWRLALK